MKKIYLIFLTLQISTFAITGATAAEKTGAEDQGNGRSIIMLEEAMEIKSLQISLDERTSTGFVIGKICDQCEKINVQITPETRAFNGANEVPLINAKDRLGRSATVFIDMKKNRVTRITW
jgi:hypothetical protein